MDLKDLVGKTIEECSDEELIERLRQTRHNRNNLKPRVTKKSATSAAKASHKRVTKVQGLLSGLSDEERQQLLLQLEGNENVADGATGKDLVE